MQVSLRKISDLTTTLNRFFRTDIRKFPILHLHFTCLLLSVFPRGFSDSSVTTTVKSTRLPVHIKSPTPFRRINSSHSNLYPSWSYLPFCVRSNDPEKDRATVEEIYCNEIQRYTILPLFLRTGRTGPNIRYVTVELFIPYFFTNKERKKEKI